jgi:hypothetical protein
VITKEAIADDYKATKQHVQVAEERVAEKEKELDAAKEQARILNAELSAIVTLGLSRLGVDLRADPTIPF